jgi:hypothetical protein
LLLIGSFAIGMIVGKDGFQTVAPVFEAGFRGALCIFLLEAGGMAEREGFEPPVELPPRRISSAVHSTTLPPLREAGLALPRLV